MEIDVLAIGAHPDDIELIIGGTIAKLTDSGYQVVIADLTRGEMGSRGTPDIRHREAMKAAKLLDVSDRISLDLKDGKLENNFENRIEVVELIRRFRPKLVMTHYWDDLHPDHMTASRLIHEVMYPCGMPNFPANGEPYRPNEFLYFMGHWPFDPSFIVDVSDYFDKKLDAIRCYQSQLHNENSNGWRTKISHPDFLETVSARARFYGEQIYKTYGEPFITKRPVPVSDPVDLYLNFPK